MVQVHSFVWLSSSANGIYWRDCPFPFFTTRASQVATVVKNLPGSAGDVWNVGLLSGSGRSPGEGHGNPLQYACLENPMDRGAWWAPVHGATKSQTWLKQLNMHTHPFPTVYSCLSWCKLIHLTRVVYFLCSFLLHWSVSVFMPVLYYYDYCSFVNTGIMMAPALLFFLMIALAIMGLSWFHTWGNETPWWGRQSVNSRARSGTCHPGAKLWLSIQGSGRSRTQTVWNKTWTPCCALTPQTSLEISLKVVWNLAAEGGAGEIEEWRRDRDVRVVHGEKMEQMGKQGRPDKVKWEGRGQCKKPYLRSELHCSKPHKWHPVVTLNPPSLKLTSVWATLTSVCPARWVVESCVKFPSVYQ